MNTRERGHVPRRNFLASLPALLMTPRTIGQSAPAPIPVRALNHMTLTVSDPKRSLEFYQGLFGMPIQARQGATTVLRIGSGPQFLALSAGGASAATGINHFCMTVDDFDVDRVLKTLADHGVTRSEATAAMKARVRMRGPDAGGAREGTPELYVGDPDGIVVQLQDKTYCGGAGVLGNVCSALEPAPTRGLLTVRDLSHFTVFVSDAQRSNTFYRDLFGFGIRAYQGPTAPILAVGSGVQFVMFTSGGAGARAGSAPAAPRPASINHVCMSMEGFDPDKVTKTLGQFGIKPRETTGGPPGPLVTYISMRMENRGGAPGGTPELYFTDPDGILIQLQDAKYCGGGGVLGDVCR